MQSNQSSKTVVLMLVLVTIFVLFLEYYWRSRGFSPTYNDDKVLWAKERKNVYQPAVAATVFCGGSRIKFDVDRLTWERITGEKVVQLALVGTPARLILRDLANDQNFRGKLIVDVAEIQFFFTDSVRREKSAREGLEYYYKETPAQKASAYFDFALESKLVFLEEGKFGLTSLLNDLQVPDRPGVVSTPFFPKEFGVTNFGRQTYMTPMFLRDTVLQNRQKAFWKKGIVALLKAPSLNGAALNALLEDLKTSADKIRSRGGLVMFIRPPSGGLYFETEKQLWPRQRYWDYLLAYTHTPGIYFSDYPDMARLNCVENSHLSPVNAAKYTASLVRILHEEKSWSFPGAK